VFESTPAAVCLEFPDLEFDGNTFVLFELEIVLCCVRLVSQLRVVSLPLSPNWSPGSTRLCPGRSLHLHSELELELLLVFFFFLWRPCCYPSCALPLSIRVTYINFAPYIFL
jgi:hypothetical protein